jgi:YggT family protein
VKSGLLVSLGSVVSWAAIIYGWAILVRLLASWLNPNHNAPFMVFLRKLCDPALDLTRRLCPLRLGGLDFSPIVLLIAVRLGGQFLSNALKCLGLGYQAMALAPLLTLTLLELLSQLTWLMMLLMAARLIISLVNPTYNNALVMIVYGLTEPLLAPLRRWFPKGPRGLDLKAVVFLVGLFLFQALILENLTLASSGWLRRMDPRLPGGGFPF